MNRPRTGRSPTAAPQHKPAGRLHAVCGSHGSNTGSSSDQVSLSQLRTKGLGRCSLGADPTKSAESKPLVCLESELLWPRRGSAGEMPYETELTEDFMGVVHHGSGVVTGEEMQRGSWPCRNSCKTRKIFTTNLSTSRKRPGSGSRSALAGDCDPRPNDGFFPPPRGRRGGGAG